MLEYVTTHDDPHGVFSRWVLDGASRANTDHGRLYTRVTEAGGNFSVSLFSDAARTQLMAQGTLDAATGDVSLAAQNASGLSGSVRITDATPFEAVIDAFYADDDDLLSLHKGIGAFLANGQFANRPGFSDPLARAKRVLDALLNARFPQGWRADSLQPLADATARYALFFLYDHLSSRADDPSAYLAARWRREARLSLPRVRLSVAGQVVQPFTAQILRS